MVSSAAHDHREQFRSSLEAEADLAKLAIATDFLELWETESCPALRHHFVTQYRRMMGADPSQHSRLRSTLERIRDGDVDAVRDLASLRDPLDHENGSGGASDFFGA